MERIGTYLFKRGFIKEEDIDVIRYAMEMIVSEYVVTGIVYLILIFMGYGIEATIHLIVFTCLRQQFEGYHAKTMFRCASISSVLFVVGSIIDIGKFSFILLFVDLVILCILCIENKKYKSFIIEMMILFIYIVLLKDYLVSVIAITAAEVIGLIFIKRREEKNESCNKKNQ